MRRSTGGRVCNCEEGDNRTENDGGGASAARAEQWVALFIIGLHGNGGHGEVGTVDGDHGGLGEAGLGVVFLDSRVDGDYRDDDEEKKVDGYSSLVHRTARAGEEDVHEDCEGDRADVHAEGAAEEDPAPEL